MFTFMIFVVGVGVGCAATWCLQTRRTAPQDSGFSRSENDPEYWSVDSIVARIASESGRAPRPRHRSSEVSAVGSSARSGHEIARSSLRPA